MTLLPDTASFHEKVQACFVAFRRRGLALSALDTMLLEQWAELDVPFEVIARGIRRASEQLVWDRIVGDEAPESLRVCQRDVEIEIKKWVRNSAGRTEPAAELAAGEEAEDDFLVTRRKKLIAAIKKATKPDVPPWLKTLPQPATYAEADRQESLALLLLIRRLPAEKKKGVLDEAKRLVAKAPPMSKGAAAESLRFHRVALAREAWTMPVSW